VIPKEGKKAEVPEHSDVRGLNWFWGTGHRTRRRNNRIRGARGRILGGTKNDKNNASVDGEKLLGGVPNKPIVSEQEKH